MQADDDPDGDDDLPEDDIALLEADVALWLRRAAWVDRSACRGVDVNRFFPHRGEPVDTLKAICRGCPVRADCLDYAMVNVERHGIWGGLSERERRRLRRDACGKAVA